MRVKIDIRITHSVIKLNRRAVKAMNAKAGQVLRMTEDRDGNVLISAIDNPDDMYMGKLCPLSTCGLSCSNKQIAERILQGASNGAFRIGESIKLDDSWWVSVITRKNYANQECIL